MSSISTRCRKLAQAPQRIVVGFSKFDTFDSLSQLFKWNQNKARLKRQINVFLIMEIRGFSRDLMEDFGLLLSIRGPQL